MFFHGNEPGSFALFTSNLRLLRNDQDAEVLLQIFLTMIRKYCLFAALFILYPPLAGISCLYGKGPEGITDTGPATELQRRQSAKNSLTVLLNNNEVLPLADLERGRFVCLTLGSADAFASRLNDYLEMPVIRLDPGKPGSLAGGLQQLAGYDRIIISVSAVAITANQQFRPFVNSLMEILREKEPVVVFFGPAFYLGQWKGIENARGLVMAYEDDDLVQDLAAQLLFGAIGASGTLPGPAGNLFGQGSGVATEGGIRLKYTIPEEAGLNGRRLEEGVGSLVDSGLQEGAFPGCRVLVAIGGMVILDRAYGFHTYAGRVRVEKKDIYDLASVTKISGPLPLYMKLYDQGLLDVDMPLSHYWDDWKSRLFRRSNMKDLIIRDLLAHQSGIVPYINYWEQTVRNGRYIRRWYRPEPLDDYSIGISDHLYLRDRFRGRVYRTIRRSELLSHGQYRYSCLPFIVSPEVISQIDGRPYTEALYEDFFDPLGATALRYNPLDRFPSHRIVPTEYDVNFRRKVVHGYVHDEASAVLGGISGNAGLFATAGDLAKLMQMYLNGGEYGGRRYISGETLGEFTRVQFPENNNRRALGFDKPLPDNASLSPERVYPCMGASPSSFGHSGFTGTFVWMDPEYELLYIFLSNRVHPTRDNNLISTMNIRTEILQAVYDEIQRQVK